jgi:hypothetical protein
VLFVFTKRKKIAAWEALWLPGQYPPGQTIANLDVTNLTEVIQTTWTLLHPIDRCTFFIKKSDISKTIFYDDAHSPVFMCTQIFAKKDFSYALSIRNETVSERSNFLA